MVVVAAIWYAPHYLAYADKPAKADVVVLIIGYDYNARKKEAIKLIEDGYAQHLVIPAFGAVYGHSMLDKIPRLTRIGKAGGMANKKIYPRHYEDTHIEVLEAKQMMEKAGFRSAIFVSSPLHMRRIKTITGKVFDDGSGNIRFVPARYSKEPERFWLLNCHGTENVITEYLKMTWFLIYGMFN